MTEHHLTYFSVFFFVVIQFFCINFQSLTYFSLSLSFPEASCADHTLNPTQIPNSNTDSLSENTLPHNPWVTAVHL